MECAETYSRLGHFGKTDSERRMNALAYLDWHLTTDGASVQQEAKQARKVLHASHKWIVAHRNEMRKKDYISPVEAWAQRAYGAGYKAATEPRDQRIKELEEYLRMMRETLEQG